MRRIRGHIRPKISNQDGFSVNRVLGKKLATSILEFADLGWIHDAVLAVGPIEAPLMGFRIVETQGETFDVAGWAIDLDGIELGAAIPNLVADTTPVQLDPGVGAC